MLEYTFTCIFAHFYQEILPYHCVHFGFKLYKFKPPPLPFSTEKNVLAEHFSMPFTKGFTFSFYSGWLWLQNGRIYAFHSSLQAMWKHLETDILMLAFTAGLRPGILRRRKKETKSSSLGESVRSFLAIAKSVRGWFGLVGFEQLSSESLIGGHQDRFKFRSAWTLAVMTG